MNLKNILKARQSYQGWSKLLILAGVFLMLAANVFAQDYTISLKERRMGNQIGVEIWAKASSSSVSKIGNMSVSVLYNTSNLSPADPTVAPTYSLQTTDSVAYDVNQTSPYITITSPYNSANSYSALTAQAANSGGTYVYQLDVNMATLNAANGYQAATTGRGTFVGLLKFNIINHGTLTNSTLSNIALNTGSGIGALSVFDVLGNNITSSVSLASNTAQTIRGITILNPNGPNEAVNRNKTYASLNVPGYPVYFERSGLLTPAVGNEFGTNVLGYCVQYSTNNGSTWSAESMRFAESRLSLADHISNGTDAALPNGGNHYSGEITTTTGTSAGYLITRGDGTQLPVVSNPGYGGVLRVIWDADEFFAPRSEQAKLRITQLNTTGNTAAIILRGKDAGNSYDVSDASFVLSRLFFLQLNGTTGYLRTADEYTNATQLTVSAWINLNSYPVVTGAQPGIVATGPGPQHLTEEGAWVLYLQDGKYPAFRCREQIGGTGRGENGGIYLASVVSPDSLSIVSDASPINTVVGHSDNWVHLAATVNNNVVSLYVNGELVAQKTNSSAPNIRMATTSHPIWVGVNPTGGLNAGDYLNAGIKEVQVWRKALTQDELRPYIMGVPTPSTVAAGGARASLIHYYDFEGIATDMATNTQQNGTNVIYYFEDASFATNPNAISAEAYPYRPDRAHIRLTSPHTGAGVLNLSSSVYPVRWVSYGVGDANTANSGDFALEFSRDGGSSWAYAIDSQTPGQLLDGNDIENATANWKPYNSATVAGAYNDLQAVTPTETNYSKTVKMRIRGTNANSQEDISYTTGNFTVAPYFSLKNTGNSIVTIDAGTGMNLTGGSGMIEAWIRPYRRPTTDEGYFPIIAKKDSVSNTGHYALRMLSSGQLQFTLTTTDGSVLTATSDATKPIDDPNALEMDSAWTHVAVYVNLANGAGTSSIKFYIDGNVQSAAAISQQLGANVTVNDANTFPTYVMYEPGDTPASSRSFIGEIKGLRYWNGVPAGVSTSGNEPTELTNFIRGALGVQSTELLSAYKTNLIAAFDFDGGSFVASNRAYNGVYSVSSTADSIQAKIIRNDGMSYAAVEPYLKLAEPIAHQVVANTTTDLKVRWVGFNYDRNAFRTGDNTLTQDADLAYSIFGGGESDDFNFNAVSSDNDLASFTDALTLPLTSTYRFLGTNPPLNQFAGKLNVSTAANDGATQSAIPAVNDNARFRLLGRATVNTVAAEEYTTFEDLRDYGPLFTMTPASNFTVRVLLEGYHLGKATAFTGVIGSTFEENGIRVSLYTDNGGRPGTLVATSLSAGDYADKDPLGTFARTVNGSKFGNVPFVFTDILDGNYFILVEQQNHLPVVSRYPAKFTFSGDDYSTWLIESGWDFQSWSGTASNVIDQTTAQTLPVNPSNYFTAWGYSESSSAETNYGATGLRFNDGQTGNISTSTSMAGMVAGDVVRDGKINAADRVKVRLDVAGAGGFQSDVTGDGNVNATDRQIVDRNDGIFYSVEDIFPNMYAGSSANNNGGGAGLTSPVAQEWETRINNNDIKQVALKAEMPTAEIKDGKAQAGSGLKYTVSAETEYDETNGLVYLTMYIQNLGAEWAPANCTFAVNYNPNQLSYANILASKDGESTIWSSQNSEFGYDVLYSAPTAAASNPLPDVHTIEIDYNNAQRLQGKNVPYSKTFLGTLVFKVRGEANEFAFKWNPLSVVYTTNGIEATKDGEWKDIVPVSTVKTAMFTYPNGGEILKANSNHFITWTKPSNETIVNIDFSHDNGNTWTRINNTPINSSDLTYAWIAPMVSSGECLLRMTDAETATIIDITDDNFSVLPSANYIVSPITVDPILFSGDNGTIKWVVEQATTLRFEFSQDGMNNWVTIANNVNSQNAQTSWNVPQNINTKNAVIAMYDAVTGQYLAKSEPFRVLSGKLTLNRPSSGEVVYSKDTKKIVWTSSNVANFTLQLSIDGGNTWQTIEGNVDATKASYNWLVLSGINTNSAVIRAVYNSDNDLEFSRTKMFTIDSHTDVDVTIGTELKVGQPYPNPFTLETNIEFVMPSSDNVSVEVFSATGTKVATLIQNELVQAGTHTLVFNGNGMATGTYYIKLQIGNESILKEVVLAK